MEIHVLVMLVGALGMAQSFRSNDEMRLHEDLLNISQKFLHVRPVNNNSETLRIRMGVAIIQIFDLDEENQVLDTLVWLRFLWKNMWMQWSPADYGGIDHIRIPYQYMWKPDIILYNSAYDTYNSFGLGLNMDSMAVVSSDGTVLWIPVSRIKSTCSINILNFPFDEQQCQMKMGSWTYDGFKLDLDFYDGLEEIDVSDYIENNEWQLVGHPAVKNVKYYPCCEEPYPDLTFTLKLKRNPAYYVYMLVIPGILTSVLIPVVFLIPVGRPEKFTLGCTLLICLTLLTMLIEMQIPTAHTIPPLIDILYVFNMFFTAVSLVLSAFVLNISGWKKEPPSCLKKVIDLLGRVCCLETSAANYKSFRVSMSSNADDGDNPIVMDPDSRGGGGGAAGAYHADWLTVATVLDRFFLIVFIVIFIIGILTFLA